MKPYLQTASPAAVVRALAAFDVRRLYLRTDVRSFRVARVSVYFGRFTLIPTNTSDAMLAKSRTEAA